jgi:hypothetical protein
MGGELKLTPMPLVVGGFHAPQIGLEALCGQEPLAAVLPVPRLDECIDDTKFILI